MVIRSSLCALAALALAGCDSLTSTTSGSSDSTWANETFFLALEDISDANVGTVTYGVAVDDDGGTAFAGINPGATPGAAVGSGTATYTAAYEVEEIYQISETGGTVAGTPREESGDITLTANFGTGTLQGTSGNLEVAGQITGTDLGGAVEYRSTSGALDGEIGNAGVIGAFHGSSDTSVFSGGFVGEVDP